MCKLLYHFRLFCSVAVLASLAGCMKDSDADVGVFMSEVEISGKVYDFDSGAFSGVENMMVVLSSFETEDRLCEYPISRDTAYTDHAGAFSIETVCMSEGWKLRLTAKPQKVHLTAKRRTAPHRRQDPAAETPRQITQLRMTMKKRKKTEYG